MHRDGARATEPCAEKACGPERAAGSFLLEDQRYL